MEFDFRFEFEREFERSSLSLNGFAYDIKGWIIGFEFEHPWSVEYQVFASMVERFVLWKNKTIRTVIMPPQVLRTQEWHCGNSVYKNTIFRYLFLFNYSLYHAGYVSRGTHDGSRQVDIHLCRLLFHVWLLLLAVFI